MNEFLRNITRILTCIISLLIAYLIVVVGILGMKNRNNLSDSNSGEQEASQQQATLLDGTMTDSCVGEGGGKVNGATATDANIELVVNSATLGDELATWEDRPKPELPQQYSIEMELVYQHPELPNGCESVALTMLLKYYGFDIEKTTIAKDYLVYSTNFVEGYMGNPFTTAGAGIYSPGLTRTANKFLDAQESDLNAKNVTDSTPEELYRYVSEDTPVVIWNTVYFLQNQPTGLKVKWGEKTYVWDNCEHCMVLSGYDLERNIVIVHDPIEGIIERDADKFWERYEKLGSMALIIR